VVTQVCTREVSPGVHKGISCSALLGQLFMNRAVDPAAKQVDNQIKAKEF